MSKKDKFTRVKLIVNPGAGNAADANKNLELVIGYLKENGLKADIVSAKPKSKATPIARQAIKDGYKIVVALGGDGTVEAVMRGLVGSKVRLGIIPVGIENNIAKNLGIPENMQEACALIASDNTCKLDVGRVKTSKGKTFSFFEMVGIGLSSAMYPDKTKTVEGDLSAVQGIAPVSEQEETKSKVYLNLDDEKIIELETPLVMVSNTAVFGKKFQLSPNASLPEGFLDISVFQGFSQGDMHGYYASMLNGGYSGKGKLERYQARKLKVKSSPKLKVTADGIDLGKGTATIKMIPGALRVIVKDKNLAQATVPEDAVDTMPVLDSVADKKTTRTKSVIPLQ